MKKAFKFRIYPSAMEEAFMCDTLDTCRKLYNDSLAERRDAYKLDKRAITYYAQKRALTVARANNQLLKQVYAQVLQDVVKRIDKAFRGFFRRVKAGEKPGYPRFKGYDRYNSFRYPQNGFKITNKNELSLSKIGTVKIKQHRPIPSDAIVKTCAIKREADHWYAVFTVEQPDIEVEKAVVKNLTYSPS